MPPLRLKRYLITGLLTFMPLWVTWLVFKFIVGFLANLGAPLVAAFVGALGWVSPQAVWPPTRFTDTWMSSARPA